MPAPCAPGYRRAAKVAELLECRGRLGLRSGAVIGVPVPEQLEAAGEEIEAATRQVLRRRRRRDGHAGDGGSR
jgi:pseudouridine-5'-phosphate glycosidase